MRSLTIISCAVFVFFFFGHAQPAAEKPKRPLPSLSATPSEPSQVAPTSSSTPRQPEKHREPTHMEPKPKQAAISLGAHPMITGAVKSEKTEGYDTPHHTYKGILKQEGGETCDDAHDIGALPFTSTGYTCDNVDDYDEVCPYSGSTAPDVVYSYTPSSDRVIDIDLYGSSYDTKVYVYEDVCASPYYACNDDYPPDYSSAIMGLDIYAGHTYYIVVDGYGDECGDYLINIEESVPCDVECPPEGIPEDEPICEDNWEDVWNAGCGGIPPVWDNISCHDIICATSGTFLYYGSDYRDTDWYRVEVSEPAILSWSVVAEFPVLIILMDAGSEDCTDYVILDYVFGRRPCDTATLSTYVPAGVYWPWVGPAVFSGIPCGAEYISEIRCSVCGDCNGDDIVDLADVVYLISYLYRSGPAPAPVEVGDCNCDGIVDLGDVVFLISYLYRGGPTPGC